MAGGADMKSARLSIAAVLFLVFSGLFLFGFDYGAIIENATSLNWTDELVVTQKDKLSLWIDIGKSERFDLAIQGSCTFSLDMLYLFDLDFLYHSGEVPGILGKRSLLSFNAGRIIQSDFTGYVLDHRSDGLAITTTNPAFNLTLSAGYTGLLLKPVSYINMSKGDVLDLIDDTEFRAPPRLIEVVTLSFPELFCRQNIDLSFVGQQDFRKDVLQEGITVESPAEGGAVNTRHVGIGLSGPVVPSLYYEMFGYFGTGSTLTYITGSYKKTLILSYLLGGEINLFLEKIRFARLTARVLFSSGDEDFDGYTDGNKEGYAQFFIPISLSSFGLIFSPQLGNIFLAELSGSIKPFAGRRAGEKFQTILKGITFFRTTTGPVSEAGIDPASTALYLGTEVDAIINFRPFSDFGTSLSFGCFLPNNNPGSGAFLDTERKPEILGRFEASFSF
jgi:hypothetical protein